MKRWVELHGRGRGINKSGTSILIVIMHKLINVMATTAFVIVTIFVIASLYVIASLVAFATAIAIAFVTDCHCIATNTDECKIPNISSQARRTVNGIEPLGDRST